METIKGLKAFKILNSRGDYTIQVDLWTKKHKVSASVPSGKSKGKYEAVELSPDRAISNLESIKSKLIGLNPLDRDEIDELLIKLDGTPNKSVLGANTTLAVSIAVNKLSAAIKGKEVYELLGGYKLPTPYMNLINGGLHAGNKLAFQEYLVIPQSSDFNRSLDMVVNIYHALRELLIKRYGNSSVNVGDEGGFAPNLKLVEEPLILISKVIDKLGYSNVNLGLDCAANSFHKNGKYAVDNKLLSKEGLMKLYERLAYDYNLYSIEDPLIEDDFKGFAELRGRVKSRLVGDDLLVTNLERINKAIDNNSCDSMILKPNQVGTILEARRAAELAKANGINVIVSHRSGETNDSFIADLAVGLNADIKAGAPCRGERLAKYNRLLEIFNQ